MGELACLVPGMVKSMPFSQQQSAGLLFLSAFCAALLGYQAGVVASRRKKKQEEETEGKLSPNVTFSRVCSFQACSVLLIRQPVRWRLQSAGVSCSLPE